MLSTLKKQIGGFLTAQECIRPSIHFRIQPISSSIFIARLIMPFIQILCHLWGHWSSSLRKDTSEQSKINYFLEFPSMTMLAAVYSLIALWPISQLLAYNLASVLDNSIIGTPKVVCEESEVILDILTAKPFIGFQSIFLPIRMTSALSFRQCFRQRPCQRLLVPPIIR